MTRVKGHVTRGNTQFYLTYPKIEGADQTSFQVSRSEILVESTKTIFGFGKMHDHCGTKYLGHGVKHCFAVLIVDSSSLF